MSPSILDAILARKRQEAAQLPAPGDPDELAPRRSLTAALAARHTPLALIAEIKRRSPSNPLIRVDFDPRAMARAYEAGGACALSVLTDEPGFGGSLSHLATARAACSLPLLRKDFVVDVRQVAEAKRAGADAILLIAACLTDALLAELMAATRTWDLEALVEVRDAAEFDRALAAGAAIVGINNRDLRTFEVDLGTTERLCERLAARSAADRPPVVSESGIKGPDDVARLARAGCSAILVGEGLLVHPDLEAATKALLAGLERVDPGVRQG